MQVRKKLRRVKRLAYLGAFTGTVITVRRVRARRDAGPVGVGSPATWPPLQPDPTPPVAAAGDLATAARTTSAAVARPSGDAPVRSDEPVAAVGDLGEISAAGGDGDGATNTDSAWVAAVDGDCPLSHPIKANVNSGIYHEPGGRFYARTRAERCYADRAAAEADGYRAAKDR